MSDRSAPERTPATVGPRGRTGTGGQAPGSNGTGPQAVATARGPFHVLAKPTGPICNLDCEYCFFLAKEALYPGDRFRMADGLLELYLRQLFEAHEGAPEVTVAWQGGEPTLMGVDFFRRVVELVQRYRRPGQVVHHTMQTNATLLTDAWCELLAQHDFLVGVSIDGPPELHDRYRHDKRGGPTSDHVLRGLRLLKRHGVEHNILCTVHAANQHRPLEVYRYFRDELGARFVQFIPIVERLDPDDDRAGAASADGEAAGAGPGAGAASLGVTDRSVDPEAWGRFLSAVFDEWVRRDVGTVFVIQFEAALAAWAGLPASLCIFAETCGRAVAVGHNGDVYSCDHFVDPDHLLGNVATEHLVDLVESPRQVAFGEAKRDALPRSCRECPVRFVCQGECPKNRFVATPDGEPGLNYLCAGYRSHFTYVDGLMRLLVDLLRQGRHADEVMGVLAGARRNDPCPCGSGRKAKVCHQRPLAERDVSLVCDRAAMGDRAARRRRTQDGDVPPD